MGRIEAEGEGSIFSEFTDPLIRVVRKQIRRLMIILYPRFLITGSDATIDARAS